MTSARNHLLFTSGLLLSALIALPGCGDDGSPGTAGAPGAESQTIDLDDPYGGFLAVDEEPAFGDPELAAKAENEEPQEDGYAGLAVRERNRAREIEEHPARVMYSLTILWGHLWNSSDTAAVSLPPETVAWQGSLALSEGALRLLSLIDFERWEDHVLPRGGLDSLAWESVTAGFLDGLRVMVVLKADSTGAVAARELTLQLNDYLRKMSTDELEDLDELTEMGDGTRISLRAFRVDPDAGARGFCHGVWGSRGEDGRGSFSGVWTTATGNPAGFIRGHYGVNGEGKRVFFGKYIGPRGQFGGFLRGTWEPVEGDNDGTPGTWDEAAAGESGRFRGDWLSRSGDAFGEVKGHWTRRAEGSGFFSGAWQGHLVVPIS